MRQARKCGRRIKWFTAASDTGTGESYSVNDGPQRGAAGGSMSLKYAHIVR